MKRERDKEKGVGEERGRRGERERSEEAQGGRGGRGEGERARKWKSEGE